MQPVFLQPIQPQRFPSFAGVPANTLAPASLRLLTWNVNFAAAHASTRLRYVLDYIKTHVVPTQEPCGILFQEISVHVFSILTGDDWVRTNFVVVPCSPEYWPPGSKYGNVTLISHSVPVIFAQSLFFSNSTMGRNAVIVDVALREPMSVRALTLRIANTHLESYPETAPIRAAQLSVVAHKLREPGVYGGIVAGDMNAITWNDATMHRDAGLADAYKGRPDDEESFTWGWQPPTRFPPGRLDRVYYTPGRAMHNGYTLVVSEPRQFGAGLQTDRRQWASDHFGLMTKPTLTVPAGALTVRGAFPADGQQRTYDRDHYLKAACGEGT